jgi:hypothetical protein
MFDAGRELLLSLGAHGEVRLVVNIGAPRRINWNADRWPDLDGDIRVGLWRPLDLSADRVDDTLARIEEEIGRALGFEPTF